MRHMIRQAREDVRLVVLNVNTVCHGVLQREEMDRLPLQDICCGCEELVKAPTPLLVSLHYACEYRNQQHFQTPTTRDTQRWTEKKNKQWVKKRSKYHSNAYQNTYCTFRSTSR